MNFGSETFLLQRHDNPEKVLEQFIKKKSAELNAKHFEAEQQTIVSMKQNKHYNSKGISLPFFFEQMEITISYSWE